MAINTALHSNLRRLRQSEALISAFDKRVGVVEQDVVTVKAGVGKIEPDVTALKNQVGGIKVADLQTITEALKQTADNLALNVTTIGNQLKSVVDALGKITPQLNILTDRVDRIIRAQPLQLPTLRDIKGIDDGIEKQLKSKFKPAITTPEQLLAKAMSRGGVQELADKLRPVTVDDVRGFLRQLI